MYYIYEIVRLAAARNKTCIWGVSHMRPQYTTGHGIELSRVTSMTRCTSRGTKIRCAVAYITQFQYVALWQRIAARTLCRTVMMVLVACIQHSVAGGYTHIEAATPQDIRHVHYTVCSKKEELQEFISSSSKLRWNVEVEGRGEG